MHKKLYYIPTTNDLSLMVYDNYSCYLFYCQLYNKYIKSMQKLLSMYFNYATDHSLTYFARNAFFLCLKPGTLQFGRPELYMDNLLVPIVSECKYSGTIRIMSKEL